MKKNIGMILFILLSSISQLLAQKTDANISGHVLNKENGEHLPFVSIGIKGTNIGTSTDATGHFYLKNLAPGKLTLIASSVGYKKIEMEIEAIAGKTVDVSLEIETDNIMLDEVVVSANRNETSRREASVIVNVVNPKLFEQTNSCNLAQGLNFQTGLRVENNCQNCGFPQLRINGLDGQYTQILMDSRPIFSSLAGVYGLEQLPTSMVERVEVIRGSGSALFGSNAIGGIVNIITKEPIRNSVSISNTTQFIGMTSPDINTSVNASLVSDDLRAGIYVFGATKRRDPYDRDGDDFSEIGKLSSETVGFRGFYKLTTQSKLTMEYHRIHEFRRGGNKFDFQPQYADIAEQTDFTADGGGLKYDWFSKNLKHRLSAFASMQYIDRASYYGAGQDPDAFGKTTDFTYVVGSQYIYSMEKCLFMPADFTAGIEYNDNKLHDIMTSYDRDLEQKTQIYSLFAQNEWKKERASILLGARLDKHNLIDNPIFSPRMNLRYNITSNIQTRLSYAAGFRAPQAYEEDLHVTAVGGDVAIISLDPDLKPENSHSLSGSIDFYHSFKKAQFNFLAEGFYTQLNDVFLLEEGGRDAQHNLLMIRKNGPGATVAGVNLEAKAFLPYDIQLQLGYTYQQSRYKEAVVWSENAALPAQKRMFRSPDHYGFLTASYLPFKNMTISCSGTFTGSMLVQHFAGFVAEDAEVETPSFVDMNVKLSYDIALQGNIKLTLNAGIQNIFDSFQSDLDQGEFRDAGYFYGPALPRSLFFGVRFSF